jgi:hypothetical protein
MTDLISIYLIILETNTQWRDTVGRISRFFEIRMDTEAIYFMNSARITLLLPSKTSWHRIKTSFFFSVLLYE